MQKCGKAGKIYSNLLILQSGSGCSSELLRNQLRLLAYSLDIGGIRRFRQDNIFGV